MRDIVLVAPPVFLTLIPLNRPDLCTLVRGSSLAMAVCTHALFETSSGYAIFEVKLNDAVGSLDKGFQASIDDYSKFSKMVTLMSFAPFQNAAHALENMNDVSESAYMLLMVWWSGGLKVL